MRYCADLLTAFEPKGSCTDVRSLGCLAVLGLSSGTTRRDAADVGGGNITVTVGTLQLL